MRFELTTLRICNPFPWTTRAPLRIGRNSKIRTYDLLVPNQAHCQAVLYSELFLSNCHSNKGAAKRTQTGWDEKHVISSVIYNSNCRDKKYNHSPQA